MHADTNALHLFFYRASFTTRSHHNYGENNKKLRKEIENSRKRMANDNVPLLPPLMDEKKNERPKVAWKGEFVKSVVYAGLDAIVTSFSLISSISAGHLSSGDVLVLGIANLIADGISMGFGDFVSSSTEKDVAVKERSVTQWDVENHRTTQKQQLIQRYQLLGMNATDATLVVNTFAKYPDILVDETLVAEKGMVAPDQSEKPWKNGLITFVAFVVFGSAPILAFIVLIPFTNSDKIKFIGACVLSAVALALLGIAKAKIAAQSYAASMGITLVNGLIAASAAYGIGWTLRNVAGLEQ